MVASEEYRSLPKVLGFLNRYFSVVSVIVTSEYVHVLFNANFGALILQFV